MKKKLDQQPEKKLIDLWKKGMGGGDAAVDAMILTMVGNMQKALGNNPKFDEQAAFCIYLAMVMCERADAHFIDAWVLAFGFYAKEKKRLLRWEKKHDQVVAFNKAQQEGATKH